MVDSDLDERAQKAAEEIVREREAGECPVIAEKAREWRVNKNRVQRRLKGIGPRTSRRPVNRKLSTIQEAVLLNWILALDEIGLSIRIDQINSSANVILQEDHFEEDSAPIVGHNWSKRFLERHPELHKVKQKPLELERKLAHDPVVLKNWFERFLQLRERYSIQDEDIWNFDETGFQIGVGKSQWIVTTSISKRQYLPSDNNREYVTSIEAVSAGGAFIEPMLILTGKVHLERFYRDLQGQVLVGLSETGYSNDELALEYIYHFDRQSQKSQKGGHRILLCDGYKSHLTREILAFCVLKNIHIFALPPHTSHILQPLDVVLFQPYKHFHAKAVDHATRTGCGSFTKLEFLAAIQGIRNTTFKRNSILSSFRECGIVPYNPAIVLRKASEYQSPPSLDLLRPSTPPNPSNLSNLPPTTPRTNRSFEKQAELLQNVTPNRQKTLQDKFIKGALIQVKTATQIRRQLAETTAAERERKERRCQSQRQLQKGGVLYPEEARGMVKQREEEGGTQLERALRREQQLRRELDEERQRRTNLTRRYVDIMTNSTE